MKNKKLLLAIGLSKKEILIGIGLIGLSIGIGFLTGDNWLGMTILALTLINGYLASTGRTINYVFGAAFYIVNAIISYQAGLFGLTTLSIVLFLPMQIIGLMAWRKKTDEKNEVECRKFTFKNSVMIVAGCVAGSAILGVVLSLIPGQRLAILDAMSSSVNICAMILLALRFREAWWVWIVNGLIDSVIWAINLRAGIDNSTMMILVMVSFLVLDTYGLIRWSKKGEVYRLKNDGGG